MGSFGEDPILLQGGRVLNLCY